MVRDGLSTLKSFLNKKYKFRIHWITYWRCLRLPLSFIIGFKERRRRNESRMTNTFQNNQLFRNRIGYLLERNDSTVD